MWLDNITGYAVILFVAVGGAIGVYICLRVKYKKKMKTYEHNTKVLNQQMQKLSRENGRLAKELDTLRVIVHKNSSRLAAFEHSIMNFLQKENKNSHDMKVSSELATMLDQIAKLTDEMNTTVKHIGKVKQPLTRIKTLDNLLSYFSDMCQSENIDFHLNIGKDVNHMVKRVITPQKLETMIGDHLKNALNAIKMSDGDFRGILLFIGSTGDCYEFSVYDSGIPFEADTMMQLGIKRVTTRADMGGNGIGFITTFEIIEEYGASLIVNEKEPGSAGYLKSVTVRFDNKNRYIIETYRPNDFPKNKRYEVVSHQHASQ